MKKNKSGIKNIVVSGYNLVANKDHQLDKYMNKYLNYSKNISKISKVINEEEGLNFIIADIGANIGDTVALIRGCGVSNQILCFEPDDEYFYLLNKNILQFENINAYKVFLGSCRDNLNLQLLKNNGTAKLVLNNVINIQIETLDDFLFNIGLPLIRLIKIDTDGYDMEILYGSKDTIQRCHPVIFFEYDPNLVTSLGKNAFDIYNFLQKLGYNSLIVYDNFGNKLLALKKFDMNILKDLDEYLKEENCAINYYDICAFHINDSLLFNKVGEINC